MSILITGSGGYIGKYLKKYLTKKGLNVYGLDKKRNIDITCNILDKKKLLIGKGVKHVNKFSWISNYNSLFKILKDH